MRRWMRRKALADESGTTLIQFMLVLPLLTVILYGSMELWKVMVVKEALRSGTEQAVRYLSVEGLELDEYPDDWLYAARVLIGRELVNNPFLEQDAAFNVAIEPVLARPRCPRRERVSDEPVEELERASFALRAEVGVPWLIQIPFLPSRTVSVVEQHGGYMECQPLRVPPTPTPTASPAASPTASPTPGSS